MQRMFKYYWVIHPVKSELKCFSTNGFTVFDNDNVSSGRTELEEEGQIFFDLCHRKVSLYNNSLWVFAEDRFDTQDKAKRFSEALCTISEALFDFKISRPGLILLDENGDCITKQPPNLDNYGSCRVNEIGEVELQRVFNICRVVVSLDDREYRYFLSIFGYLRDIHQSPKFIGELALWSFLEHHWATNKVKTDVSVSLKNLLNLVFENRKDRSDFNKAIRYIGKDLGREYDEHMLRNILAHGKHFTLSENWTEENWKSFYEVHETLYSLVLKGIETEVILKK